MLLDCNTTLLPLFTCVFQTGACECKGEFAWTYVGSNCSWSMLRYLNLTVSPPLFCWFEQNTQKLLRISMYTLGNTLTQWSYSQNEKTISADVLSAPVSAPCVEETLHVETGSGLMAPLGTQYLG